MGRIVKNHSTHIEGLIDILEILSKNILIKSVTPGSLHRVKGFCEKMRIRVTRELRGGFKLVARKGRMVQQVYILTKLSEKELNDLIAKTIDK